MLGEAEQRIGPHRSDPSAGTLGRVGRRDLPTRVASSPRNERETDPETRHRPTGHLDELTKRIYCAPPVTPTRCVGAPYSAIPHALVSHFVPLSDQHFADEHAIDRTSIRPVNIRYSAMARATSGMSARSNDPLSYSRCVSLVNSASTRRSQLRVFQTLTAANTRHTMPKIADCLARSTSTPPTARAALPGYPHLMSRRDRSNLLRAASRLDGVTVVAVVGGTHRRVPCR